MYTRPVAVYMAKLYWRIKKKGKWTWRPATVLQDNCISIEVATRKEEE